MTIAQAKKAVAAVWPYVVLQLYVRSEQFVREGPPYSGDTLTSDDIVLKSPGDADGKYPDKGPVLLLGAMSREERRGRIYSAFGLEPEFECFYQQLTSLEEAQVYHGTLDHIQILAEKVRALFVQKHGRPPHALDKFTDLFAVKDRKYVMP